MTPFGRLNFLNVGLGGTFTASGAFRSTRADVDRLMDHVGTLDSPRLAVHFHGGLVSEEAGMAVARSVAGVYQGAGSHPVTFVWETGALETIAAQLRALHRTRLFRKLRTLILRRAAKYVGDVVAGRGAGRRLTDEEVEGAVLAGGFFPMVDAGAARGGGLEDVDEAELQAEFDADLQADLEIEEIFREEAAETPLLDRAQLENAAAKGILSWGKAAKTLATITYRAIKRHTDGRDHGFYPTVVEELLREIYLADLGAWTWSTIKEKAEAMFATDGAEADGDVRAGAYFLQRLGELRAAKPSLVVDLVGHSAGSIAICHMLRAMAERGDAPVRRIAFLAPACRTDLMHGELVRHPERFAEFRMFTMSDAQESADELVPFVYTRSLLYFISGVLEDEADATIAGLDRHLTGDDPYTDEHLTALAAFIAEPRRLVLSRTVDAAAMGQRSTSTTHGGFDEDAATRASLTHWLGEATTDGPE